jgi:hypothetical protein
MAGEARIQKSILLRCARKKSPAVDTFLLNKDQVEGRHLIFAHQI